MILKCKPKKLRFVVNFNFSSKISLNFILCISLLIILENEFRLAVLLEMERDDIYSLNGLQMGYRVQLYKSLSKLKENLNVDNLSSTEVQGFTKIHTYKNYYNKNRKIKI